MGNTDPVVTSRLHSRLRQDLSRLRHAATMDRKESLLRDQNEEKPALRHCEAARWAQKQEHFERREDPLPVEGGVVLLELGGHVVPESVHQQGSAGVAEVNPTRRRP